MALNPKHFEDVEDFGDFDDKLDAAETDMGEMGPNHPLSWRRIIIERAVINVKKAVENKVDVAGAYKKGELVFDGEANKFGRIVESKPGHLNIALIAGGKLIRQDIDPIIFVKDNRDKLTLPELARKLFVSEVEVIALLNRLEAQADKNPHKQLLKPKAGVEKNPVKINREKKLAPKKKPVIKAKVNLEKVKVKAKKTKLISKVTAKKAKPTKNIKLKPKQLDKKNKLTKNKKPSFTKLLPKGITTDPIMDPNGYIQQNFLLMSNRELSLATGLSEHTIRRKLGEWNLKRKDFVNKA